MRTTNVISIKDHLIAFIQHDKDDELTCHSDEGKRGSIIEDDLVLYPAPITYFLFGGKYRAFVYNDAENKWDQFLDAPNAVPNGEIVTNNRMGFRVADISARGIVQEDNSGGTFILVLPKKREVLQKWVKLLGQENMQIGTSHIKNAEDIGRDENVVVFHQERPKKRDANTFSDTTFDSIEDEIVFE